MRGINGVNDGQQIYSYDASFTDANNDEVKSLFTYQPPALDAGVIMTEEIAAALPRSFIYRRLENGACAIAQNTYLGRDYMGSAGRFGNHLSHVVLADEADVHFYPCEFYGGSVLRDHMEFEEVNNPERPDFLPEPVLERGYTVDIDSVTDFLSVGDRTEIFKNMLYATLSFESERKRVVICDEPENIVMWIAAIEYALPLKMALNINFSTYDYDPALSASQICGVIPKGSRYSASDQNLHFVFDFYQNVYAKFDKDDRFFDFVDTAMSFSYDSLQDFHRFLTEGYSADKADEKLYAAYRLYSLLSDGMEGLDEDELKSALEFADEYALPKEQLRIFGKLFSQTEYLLNSGTNTFLCVMRYAVSKYDILPEEYRGVLKEAIVDKVLYEFLHTAGSEKEFVAFFKEIESGCREMEFSIATELMTKKKNSEKLFKVMREDIAEWQIAFIVKIISSYVKDLQLKPDELSVEHPMGQIYYGLVKAVYYKSSRKGFCLVCRILDEFSFDCTYLVNMALNVEGMLLDLQDGKKEADEMWRYFGQNMMRYQASEFKTAYSVLGECQRYEQIYMLYSLSMSGSVGAAEKQDVFLQHYNTFISRDESYAQQYGGRIYGEYYRGLKNMGGIESLYDEMMKLFEVVSGAKADFAYAEDLVKDIARTISYKGPAKEQKGTVKALSSYLHSVLHKPLTGRLLFLVIGVSIDECQSSPQMHETLEKLKKLTAENKADMTRLKDTAAVDYMDWILPAVCRLCTDKRDMEDVYGLFIMSDENSLYFLVFCADAYFKQSKGDKEYGVFCEFLELAAKKGNAEAYEEIGKILCGLNKQKLQALDTEVKDRYKDDKTVLKSWKDIRETAAKTNPLLNGLSKLLDKVGRKNK